MADSQFVPLDPSSDTLAPLPHSHRIGLFAVTITGTLSFASSATLFWYLAYKFYRWYKKTYCTVEPPPQHTGILNAAEDLQLGLAAKHLALGEDVRAVDEEAASPPAAKTERRPPNQFLVLVLNLFAADFQQATAFMLNVFWVSRNEITVGSRICDAQGWFVGTGDLASSLFITAIAVHTYLALVRGYKPPYWLLYSCIVFLWFFNYFIVIAGIIATQNGRESGGFYVRAVAWCWINVEYENLRLWLHYFWIFASLGITSILYALIFINFRNKHSSRRLTHSRPSGSASIHPLSPKESRGRCGYRKKSKSALTTEAGHGHHPAFLIYPIIYVFCTAPLALGRILSMSGYRVSVTTFCVAGALIASNGWLDVILFSVTRSSLIFNAEADAEDMGVETFAFMRTPHGRRFGNVVWVQGGAQGNDDKLRERGRKGSWGWPAIGDKLTLGMGREGAPAIGAGRSWRLGSSSQESLRNSGAEPGEAVIQMDTVTSVVIEVDPHSKPGGKYRDPSASAHSMSGLEKELEPRIGRAL